ncbi:hypothetical protein PUN28_018868 [Cardiocondyla obscurior]|uniref:Uncharacterized protein n=1 Tax=Cardiocondyla obscurior TaxID=286306 RepID=A0AAW2EHU7_9HYME
MAHIPGARKVSLTCCPLRCGVLSLFAGGEKERGDAHRWPATKFPYLRSIIIIIICIGDIASNLKCFYIIITRNYCTMFG